MKSVSLGHLALDRRWLAAALALFVGAPAGSAQGEDEWYDPTDWFDGNNIESDDTFDYEAYDFDYDYGFNDTYDYGDSWATYPTWGAGTWHSDYYDANYWDNYDWNADSSQNQSQENQDRQNQNREDQTRTYTYVMFIDPISTQSGSDSQQSSSKQGMKKGSGQDNQKSGVARLNGTIEGLRDMQLKRESGATARYTLAKVRLENGKTSVVNLGRKSALENVNLKQGDSIQAVGRRGTVEGETVFVAHKIKAGGKTIDANPVIRLSPSRTVQNQQNQKTIQGTVASIDEKTASSAGKKDHTLVNLRLENGQSATVDLGPAASLEKIDLQEGEMVTVKGRSETRDGQQVLVPDLMKVDGKKVSALSE